MDEKDEKEYNDIASLSAYLHSGKMQALKAAEERAELGLPPEQDEQDSDGGELEGVLFTLGGKKRQAANTGGNVISRSEYDAAIRGQSSQSSQSGQHVQKAQAPQPPSLAESLNAAPAAGASAAATAVTADAAQTAPLAGSLNSSAAPAGLPAAQNSAQANAPVSVKPVTRAEAEKHHTENGSAAAKAGAFLSGAMKKLGGEGGKKPSAPAKHKSPPAENAASAEAPSLAESLSASLGFKAAEEAERQKNALPPEDTPEVFDVTEGSVTERRFDNAVTRLMNAVNDPVSKNAEMRMEMEAEEEEEREERQEASRLRRGYERQRQGTRTLAYILIALFLCTVIIGAAAYASSYIVKCALDFAGIGNEEFTVDVEIPDNASIEEVAAILSENNIIQNPRFFKLFSDVMDSEFIAKLRHKEGDAAKPKEIIGGRYSLTSTMAYSTLLSTMRSSTVEKYTVDIRIIEGMTAREIGELLEQNYVCLADDFEKYYKDILNIYDFERRVKESPDKFDQLEGYLFPDTYQFYVSNYLAAGGKPGRNETAEEAREKLKEESAQNAETAAKKMYSNFNEKITRAMYKRMGEMNMTLDEVIALASMVQKEAAYAEDMGYVASVFLNRIRNSAEFPYLQSDVTVIYVENNIKPYITGTEAYKNRIYNAYNTYVCQGIPAGAVCNPGLDAINAVLNAPETPYFYFCANAETGEIFYAATHEEHEQNLILAGIAGNGESSGGEAVEPLE